MQVSETVAVVATQSAGVVGSSAYACKQTVVIEAAAGVAMSCASVMSGDACSCACRGSLLLLPCNQLHAMLHCAWCLPRVSAASSEWPECHQSVCACMLMMHTVLVHEDSGFVPGFCALWLLQS